MRINLVALLSSSWFGPIKQSSALKANGGWVGKSSYLYAFIIRQKGFTLVAHWWSSIKWEELFRQNSELFFKPWIWLALIKEDFECNSCFWLNKSKRLTNFVVNVNLIYTLCLDLKVTDENMLKLYFDMLIRI